MNLRSKKDKKPNGKHDGTFVISIDDGYVEYAYDLDISNKHSIGSVFRKIAKAFKVNAGQGRLRTQHCKFLSK